MLGPAGWRALWVFLALVLYSYNPHIELSLKKKTDIFSWRKGPFLRARYLRDGAACRRFCAAALEIRPLAGLGSGLRHLHIQGSFTGLSAELWLLRVPLRGRLWTWLGGTFWKRPARTLHVSEYRLGEGVWGV